LSDKDGIRLKELIVEIHNVREFRPWLANTPFWNGIRRLFAASRHAARGDGASTFIRTTRAASPIRTSLHRIAAAI